MEPHLQLEVERCGPDDVRGVPVRGHAQTAGSRRDARQEERVS